MAGRPGPGDHPDTSQNGPGRPVRRIRPVTGRRERHETPHRQRFANITRKEAGDESPGNTAAWQFLAALTHMQQVARHDHRRGRRRGHGGVHGRRAGGSGGARSRGSHDHRGQLPAAERAASVTRWPARLLTGAPGRRGRCGYSAAVKCADSLTTSGTPRRPARCAKARRQPGRR